jgi:hypothetical protein
MLVAQECGRNVGIFDVVDGDLELHPSVVSKGNGGGGLPVQMGKEIKVAQFLNRMLGLKIEEQAALFDYFEATYQALRRTAKMNGEISVRTTSCVCVCVCACVCLTMCACVGV